MRNGIFHVIMILYCQTVSIHCGKIPVPRDFVGNFPWNGREQKAVCTDLFDVKTCRYEVFYQNRAASCPNGGCIFSVLSTITVNEKIYRFR